MVEVAVMPKPRKHTPRELQFRTKDWSCPIVCRRCKHRRANGAICKNKVCFGSPVCWVHNSILYGLKIKESSIPKPGEGLFATRVLKKDAWISPYIGEIVGMKCVHQRYPGTAPYTMQMPGPKQLAVDCACTRGIGSLANCRFNKNGTVSSLSRHNCVSRYRPVGDGTPGLWLKATKTIKAGDEIFLWYGDGGYKLQNNHSTKPRAKIPDSRPC